MSAFHKSAFLSVGFDPSIVIRAIVTSGCNYCGSAKCLEAAASSAHGAGHSLCLASPSRRLEERRELRDAANEGEEARHV